MNSVELIEIIKKNGFQRNFCEFGMYSDSPHSWNIEILESLLAPIEKLNLGNIKSVEFVCNSDELYNVVYFEKYNIDLKFTGEYDSYGSGEHDYEGSITEVFPKEWESLDKEMEDYFSSIKIELNTLFNKNK